MPQISLKLSETLKSRLNSLVREGLFPDKAEAIREGIRDLLLKYKEDKKDDQLK